jgi:hypothetical protein
MDGSMRDDPEGGPVPPGPPLAHLRVVDLTDLRGALAGRMLADRRRRHQGRAPRG